MAVACVLYSARVNGVNVKSNTVPALLTSATAINISATQNTPIGGNIYVGGITVTTTNAAQNITPSLWGSLDGTNFYKLTDMKQADLSTAAVVVSNSTTPVEGLYDLSKFELPYWYIGGVAASTCTASVRAHIVLP